MRRTLGAAALLASVLSVAPACGARTELAIPGPSDGGVTPVPPMGCLASPAPTVFLSLYPPEKRRGKLVPDQ